MSTEFQANQFTVEDEISLIDLIRVLFRRKWILLGVFVVGMLTALVAAMLHEQQFLYSASIEVGTVLDMHGDSSPVESTTAVISRLNEAIIPSLLADYASKHRGSKLPGISARSSRSSELLILEGKGSLSQAEAIVELENAILARLKKGQSSLFELEKMEVVNALVDKDAQLQEETNRQESFKAALARNERLYLLREAQLKESIRSIERLTTSRNKLGRGDSSVLAQLLADAEIEKAQRMRLELEQSVNLDLPAAKDELRRQLVESARKQTSIEADIVKTKLQLENVRETRFVSEPDANPTPTGAGKKGIIAVGTVLSALLAIIAVFLAEFIVRTRQELAGNDAG